MIIIESGPKTPDWNMEADQKRLEEIARDDPPTLRFYEWSVPSVTYGYFIDPWEHFDPYGVEKYGLALARRPTGGGIIFHGYDLAFSIIVSSAHPFYALNPLCSYQMINTLILKAIDSTMELGATEATRGGFCMAKPTKYDLLWRGKKVGGAAQRKTKKGLLHHMSICRKLPEKAWLKEILKEGERVYVEMKQMSFALNVENLKDLIINSLVNY